MEKPILGKDKILKFRRLADREKEGAARLALQIEHTIQYEANADSKMTKDGPINYSGGVNTTIEMSAVSTRDDVNNMLRQAVLKQELWGTVRTNRIRRLRPCQKEFRGCQHLLTGLQLPPRGLPS